MTQGEWLACNEPLRMLEFLSGKTSDRKMRHFALLCCQRAVRNAKVDADDFFRVAESWADSEASDMELNQVREVAGAIIFLMSNLTDESKIVAECALSDAVVLAYRAGKSPEAKVLGQTIDFLPDFDVPRCRAAAEEERAAQVASLRDLFGTLPFRPIAISPSLLIWDDGLIVRLASTIYDEKSFEQLSVLADALEEAGCADQNLVGHLRSEGPHVRGCWPLDLLLGKS